MEQYQTLLKKIISEGDVVFEPRTQTSIMQIPSSLSSYNLRKGFPLMTTKFVKPELPAEELFWKLRGEDHVGNLVQRGVNFWTANAFDRHLKESGRYKEVPKHSDRWAEEFATYSQRINEDPSFAREHGSLGPVYGFQWRHRNDQKGGEIDRLEKVIQDLKNNPHSRYHVLNAWNDAEISDMAIGPCPFWHQFTASNGKLDLTVTQRSADTYLGVPFNIAQDALFLEMMAKETGMEARKLEHLTINTHIYLGVGDRAEFLTSRTNLAEFKEKFGQVNDREGFLKLRDWYLAQAGPESQGNEKKDHMPFVLEQLSKEPKTLPTIALKEVPLLDAINLPTNEVFELKGYDPHRWKSKAFMAV